jgi:serine/threonine protein phosphatase PrpC
MVMCRLQFAAMLTAYGVSHPGRVRKSNEDALFFDVNTGLFVVADGMGGHSGGEVASQMAVDTITGFLERARGGEEFTWPFGIDPGRTFEANCLATSMRLANRDVFQQAESRAELAGMGTTIVAALVRDLVVTFCGVGDSRIYSFANGRFVQLTRDDSWLADLLDSDDSVDEKTLASHPMRHVLTKVIGAQDDVDLELFERELETDETLLFCTDGLHGFVEGQMIAEVLRSVPALEAAAHTLIDTALAGGGGDNVTVLLVRNRA